MPVKYCENPKDDVVENTEPTQLDQQLYIKYQYMLMHCPPKQYWYEKCSIILRDMKDIDIPGERRCIVTKDLMYIDQCIKYLIDYSGKDNITNMGIPYAIYIFS